MDSKRERFAREREVGGTEVVRWADVPPGEPDPDPAPKSRGRRQQLARRQRLSGWITAAVTVGSAIAGALAGCHPTGTAALDVAYPALLAGLVTLAASRASRATLLILATVATVMSRSWLFVPAGIALALAFGAVFPRRAYQRVNVLVGAVAVQVVLRWPSVGFHGATALVAAVIIAPVLVSAWSRQRRRRRRGTAIAVAAFVGGAVVLSLPVVIGALLARAPVNRGIAATRLALTAVSDGNPVAATAHLKAAAAALSQAHTDTGSWWTLGGRVVPVVAQQEQAMAQATAAVHTLTAAAEKEAGALNFADLRLHQGQIDLAAIADLHGPLVALDGQVTAAQRALDPRRSPWLAAPIATRLVHLSKDLARARHSADLGVQAVDDAPALLGGQGPRRYFVAFMTPAETRGLGGFLGAYGELAVDQGRVSLVRSGQMSDLNTVLQSATPQLTGLPGYVNRYGAFDPAGHFQDVTYSPDFPTVAKVITELYPQAGGDHLDGVLALDPEALADLLRLTGPVPVAGLPTPLTAANAANILLRTQYSTFSSEGLQASRHDFLQDALRGAFQKISSVSLPPHQLSATLAPVVQQGRLLFWSDHPSEQPFLHNLGIDGAFPQPGPDSDLLAVTTANAANNKVDAYLHQQLNDRIIYDPATGHVASTVTLTLYNAAPSSGLPAYVIDDNAGTGLPPGTNSMWLSVYSPLLMESSTANGQLIAFSPGTPELGVKAYSAFLEIPAGSTETLTIMFDGDLAPGPSYHMALRLQPLAYAPTASVTVQPAAGWVSSGPATWDAGNREVQTRSWTLERS